MLKNHRRWVVSVVTLGFALLEGLAAAAPHQFAGASRVTRGSDYQTSRSAAAEPTTRQGGSQQGAPTTATREEASLAIVGPYGRMDDTRNLLPMPPSRRRTGRQNDGFPGIFSIFQ